MQQFYISDKHPKHPARRSNLNAWIVTFTVALVIFTAWENKSMSGPAILPNNVPVQNETGIATTISLNGAIDLTNEFSKTSAPTAGDASPVTSPVRAGR